MRPVTRLFTAVLLAAVSVPAVHAADFDLPVVVDEAPEFVPVEIGSGWYLRGDIGYSVASSGGAGTYRTFDGATLTYGTNAFTSSDIETDFSGGFGFGYIFNRWLRADMTAEVFKGDFTGSTVAAPTPGIDCGVGVGIGCASSDTSSFTAYSLMANAYVDMGTFKHITPYVGAGVGFTSLRWDGLTNRIFCQDTPAACGGAVLPAATTHPGYDSWRFTYAFMAGASYDISRNTKIDIGYRFRKIDGGDFFGFDTATAAAGATGVQGTDDGLTSHEVRVGLRYEIW